MNREIARSHDVVQGRRFASSWDFESAGHVKVSPARSSARVLRRRTITATTTTITTTTTTTPPTRTRRWRRRRIATTRRPKTWDWRPVIAVVPRDNRGRGTGCDRYGGARDGVPSRGAHGGDAHRTPPGISCHYPGSQPAKEPGLLYRRRFLNRRLRAANVHAAHTTHAARGREGKGRANLFDSHEPCL